MADSFRTHFRMAGGGSIAGCEQEISWEALKELVDKVDGEKNRDRGVVFHYGMNSGAFKLGLSPVALEPKQGSATDFTYDHKVKVYSVTGGAIEGTGTDYVTWLKRYTQAPLPTTGTYFNAQPTLELRRTDAVPQVFEAVVYKTDAEHEVMPFEREIERLHRENRPPASADYDEFVVVTCASTYDEAANSYRHRLMLHMRYRLHSDPSLFVDALSDRSSPDDDPAPFFERAADLGNLCPPEGNCGVYVLQRSLL